RCRHCLGPVTGPAARRCDSPPRISWWNPRADRPAPPSEIKDFAVMLTTDLGACEWFVWDLRRSNLIDRGQLDQIIGEFLSKNPRAEPPALAEYLIGKGILTDFQAERLLQGKTQGFVLGPFTLMDALGA